MDLIQTFSPRCRALLLSGGLCLLASAAAAQGVQGTPTPVAPAPVARPERPYRGTFASPAANEQPILTLDAMFGGGATKGDPRGAAGGGGGGVSGTGDATGTGAGTGSATLAYSWTTQTKGFSASNQIFTDYYPNATAESMQFREFASADFFLIPRPSTRISIHGGFKNLPELAFSDLHGADAGVIVTPDLDHGLTMERYTRWGTGLEVSHKMGSRVVANFGSEYGRGKVAEAKEWTVVGVSGSISYAVTKGLSVRGGYKWGGQRDELAASTQTQRDVHPRFDFGVDFNRPISLSRRTTLSFYTGVAGLRDNAEQQNYYNLVGGAQINREIGRTWVASFYVGRNVRHNEALSEPVLSDTLGGSVKGLISRRVEFDSYFGASKGTIGRSMGSNGFDTLYGSTSLSYGLTRYLALGADYTFTNLNGEPDLLVTELRGKNTFHSLRAYVKLWAPLISKPRKF